jgi:pimeloyl-ACP methyl ester carboxylesterase
MRLMFLPGAGGAAAFWHPFGATLPEHWSKQYMRWPGLGAEPGVPGLATVGGLVDMCANALDGETIVVAQSMGTIMGLRLALDFPGKVARLVLVAPTGGASCLYQGEDWRGSYAVDYPDAAPWVTRDKPAFDEELGRLRCPVLIVCGDADPLSAPEAGRELAAAIAGSKFAVLSGGGHAMANDSPDELAKIVLPFLHPQ